VLGTDFETLSATMLVELTAALAQICADVLAQGSFGVESK